MLETEIRFWIWTENWKLDGIVEISRNLLEMN